MVYLDRDSGGIACTLHNDLICLAITKLRSLTSNSTFSFRFDCIATCPRLSTPPHGQLKVQSYYDGGIAVYTCDSGYYILGSFDRICKQGNWSGSDPACQGIRIYIVT